MRMIDAARAAVERKQFNELTLDFPIDHLRQLFVEQPNVQGKKFVADATVYQNLPEQGTWLSKVDSLKDFYSKGYLGEGCCRR